jgi:hypothetical protein
VPQWVGIGAHTRLDVLRLVAPGGEARNLLDVAIPRDGRLRLSLHGNPR